MELCQKMYNIENVVIYSLKLQYNQSRLLAGQWGNVESLWYEGNVTPAWRKSLSVSCKMDVLLLNFLIFYSSILFWDMWNSGLILIFFPNLIYVFSLYIQHILHKIFSHFNWVSIYLMCPFWGVTRFLVFIFDL